MYNHVCKQRDVPLALGNSQIVQIDAGLITSENERNRENNDRVYVPDNWEAVYSVFFCFPLDQRYTHTHTASLKTVMIGTFFLCTSN